MVFYPETKKRKAAKSKFKHKIKQMRIDGKEKQLDLALKYCKENNCRGTPQTYFT